MSTESAGFTQGSDNIFADLGLDDADELLPKSQLAWSITKVIRDRGLTQTEAADRFGVHQARISDVMNGRLDRFTLDRLLKLANAAGLNLGIRTEPVAEPEQNGRTFVTSAPTPPSKAATMISS